MSSQRWVCSCGSNNMLQSPACFQCGRPRTPTRAPAAVRRNASRIVLVVAGLVILGGVAAGAVAFSRMQAMRLSREPAPVIEPLRAPASQPAALASPPVDFSPALASSLPALSAHVLWSFSAGNTAAGVVRNTGTERIEGLQVSLGAVTADSAGGIYTNPREERVLFSWSTPEFTAEARANRSWNDQVRRFTAGNGGRPSEVSLGPGEQCSFILPHGVGLVPADLSAQDATGREVKLTQELHQPARTAPAPQPGPPQAPVAGPSTPRFRDTMPEAPSLPTGTHGGMGG